MLKNPAHLIPTDDVVEERTRRYGEHLPVPPLRACRVPSVLAEHPKFRALAAERQAVRDAELRLDARHAEWQGRTELARAEHRNAQHRAVLTGEDPPPPLVLEAWPYPEHTRPMFDRLHQVIEAAELGLLAEGAARWSDDLHRRAAPMRRKLDDARATVARMEADLAVYDPAHETLERLAGTAVEPDDDDDKRAADVERRTAPVSEEERAGEAQIVADFEAATAPKRGVRR